MACETRPRRNQTFNQRKTEVREAIASLSTLIASGKVTVLVSKATGSAALRGWDEARDAAGLTDGCSIRLVRLFGSALAQQAIRRAEILAGRTIDAKALNALHSHDGGMTYHKGH